ncbi:hypothetical protein BDQ17DRAFT_1430473 [Cyathus striatus]|nr:hypothetical protein BDQ17DRAFT_1430473 [Cyathus striatus]
MYDPAGKNGVNATSPTPSHLPPLPFSLMYDLAGKNGVDATLSTLSHPPPTSVLSRVRPRWQEQHQCHITDAVSSTPHVHSLPYLEEDAKGSPEKLTRAAKILEIGGDAVAPPPIIRSTASTLPPRPVRDISSDIEYELNTEKAELNIQKSTKTISKAETGFKATSESKAKTGSKAASEFKAKTGSKDDTVSIIEHGLGSDSVELDQQKDAETGIENEMQIDIQVEIEGLNRDAGEIEEGTDKEKQDHSDEKSEEEKSTEDLSENNTFEMRDSSKDNSEEMDSENEEEDNDDDENLEETTPKKAKVSTKRHRDSTPESHTDSSVSRVTKSSHRSTSHNSAVSVPPHSPSPIELEGASRTHGGFSRGRAFGNTFNSADFDGTKDTFMHIEESDSGTVMGKVVIYSDRSKQSPPFVVSQPLGTKLGDILHNICVEYEYTAIQSCFIYVQDDDMWVLKGKYHKALEKNEVVPWVKDEKGKHIISVSAESITEMVPALPLTLGGGTTSQLRQPFEPASYPFEPASVQYKIAFVFNVAKALCERNTKKDIQLSYQKYLAIHDIFAKFPGMIANNIWKERRPSNDDIIEVFMSKSTYYYYYSNPFSMVFEIPALEKWLKGDSDAPCAVEVWGLGVKPSLDSLKKLLNNIKVDHSSSENAESENEEGSHK